MDSQSFTEIVLPDSIKKQERCAFCNKPLPKRHVNHVNIGQDQPEHKFCSRTCKEKWCHEQLNCE